MNSNTSLPSVLALAVETHGRLVAAGTVVREDEILAIEVIHVDHLVLRCRGPSSP